MCPNRYIHRRRDDSPILDDRLASALIAHDPLLPPWRRYPEIVRGSVNWNMGEGESYICVWEYWIARMSNDDFYAYLRKFAPIPSEWVDWIAYRAYDDYDGRNDEVYARRLSEQGLFEFDEWSQWNRRMKEEWAEEHGIEEEADDT